jgi:NADH-quinone oxidoreductase subunit G
LAWLPGLDETPRLARLFAGGYPVPGGRALPRPGEAEAGPEPVCRPDPEPEAAPPDGWLRLLLVEWTFGTEAMSGHSASIRQAEPAPRLLMHTVDAAEAGLAQAVRVVVDLPGGPVELDLAVTEDMARGVVVMPRHRLLEWQRLDSRASGGAARPLIPRSAIRRAGP